MYVTEKFVLKKKLKAELAHVRITIKGIGGESSRGLAQKICSVEENGMIPGNIYSSNNSKVSVGRKRKAPEKCEQPFDVDFPDSEQVIIENSEAASTVTGAFKCGNLGNIDDKCEKGPEMDVIRRRQCTTILKRLMNHRSGWVFLEPVDPVKLEIPDYFSIISKPMDLGTIKGKLERKLYSNTHMFAEDVRLTFSNAMRYNPPGNMFHGMAKDLNDIFNTSWKALERKWRKECPVTSQQSVIGKTQKPTIASRKLPQQPPSCNLYSVPKKCLTSADRLKLQKELVKFSGRSIPPRLFKFLQKAKLLGQFEDGINVDIEALDEEILLELNQIIKSCSDTVPTKSAGTTKNLLGYTEDACKGSGRPRLSANHKNHTGFPASVNLKCPSVSNESHCCQHNDSTQALSADVDSERSYGKENFANHSSTLNLNCKAFTVRSDHWSSDSGPAAFDGDNVQPTHHSSQSYTPTKDEDDPPCEIQMSPARALRAAMLKSRFADTIVKAQHKTLLNHGEKSDQARILREKEKLEKKQQEEKARIEAQVKAAEAAAHMKAEMELKMQREKAREAARLALEKMEKTVDIDENNEILKELENLGYSQPVNLEIPNDTMVNFMDVVEMQCGLMNPLQQLGLFIKDDDVDEEIESWISAPSIDVEEGEIACL